MAVPTGRPTNACCWRAQIVGGRADLWLPSQGNYAAPMCPQRKATPVLIYFYLLS